MIEDHVGLVVVEEVVRGGRVFKKRVVGVRSASFSGAKP